MREHTLWLVTALFVVVYATWPFLGLPTPLYAPVTGQILWEASPDDIVMGWYGRVLGSAVLTAALTLLLFPLGRWIPADKGQLTTVAAGLLTLAAMILIAWTEWAHWFAGR